MDRISVEIDRIRVGIDQTRVEIDRIWVEIDRIRVEIDRIRDLRMIGSGLRLTGSVNEIDRIRFEMLVHFNSKGNLDPDQSA